MPSISFTEWLEPRRNARDRTLKMEEDLEGVLYKTDLIPIRMEAMSYARHGVAIFKNVQVEVPQGPETICDLREVV